MRSAINNPRLKALFAVFCAVGWSIAYPLIKAGYSEFQIAYNDTGGKILFGGIRFFAAGIIIIILCLFSKTKLNANQKKDYFLILLLGVINTAFHYTFAYIGLGYNPGSRSTILDSTGTFILIILSPLFFSDDCLIKRKALGCILGFSGIILATVNPGENVLSDISFMGDGMILINAVCAAFGGIITRIVSNKMNILSATGISMTIGGIIMIITGLILNPYPVLNITVKGILILLILILISAVCFSLYNKLLALYPISEIAIFNALIPVLGVIFSSLLLSEELKWQYICSVIIVSFGIYLLNSKAKTKPAAK